MAAGLGFKTFTTGEVLTAADTNGYLMQGVLVFASSAARAAAITSPQEGQYSYLKDTNSTEYYDGAAWIAAPIGDITGVTAGTGISGGGTSGTVTITNDMATTITAAGDIVIGTGSGTYDNLPIGTTAQVLTADTTVSPYKVKWATPAGASGAVTQIADTTLASAAADITFSSIAATYNHLMIIISGRCSSASVNGTDLLVQLNSDTGVNYRHARNTKYGTAGATVTIEGGSNFSSMSLGNLWGGTASSNTISGAQMIFPNYKGTTLTKSMIFQGGCLTDAPGAGSGFGQWINFSAITTIKIFSTGGNLDTGTRATLYGWT